MFFTCMKCRTRSTETTKEASESAKEKPPNNSTENTSSSKASGLIQKNVLAENIPSKFPLSRTISTSSFASLKSTQSFYSVRSEHDSDFYSVCSENSMKERY